MEVGILIIRMWNLRRDWKKHSKKFRTQDQSKLQENSVSVLPGGYLLLVDLFQQSTLIFSERR